MFLRKYLGIGLAAMFLLTCPVWAGELFGQNENEKLQTKKVQVEEIGEEVVQLTAGEERSLDARSVAGQSWEVDGMQVAEGEEVPANEIPIGFHDLEVKGGQAKKMKVLIAPPPPALAPSLALKSLAKMKEEQATLAQATLSVADFQIVRAESDTLNQITIEFANVVDFGMLADASQYLLTDLDEVNSEITDENFEYRGASVDAALGTVTLGIGGMSAQPGELFSLQILGLEAILTQPEQAIEPETEVGSTPAPVPTETVPEPVSTIDTLNQITLVASDLASLGTGVDLTLAENYQVQGSAEEAIEVRGAAVAPEAVTLAIYGMAERPGAEYRVRVGTGEDLLEIVLKQQNNEHMFIIEGGEEVPETSTRADILPEEQAEEEAAAEEPQEEEQEKGEAVEPENEGVEEEIESQTEELTEPEEEPIPESTTQE